MAFGGLAVIVASVGLYGVIGYTITQRMHELGLRIALGARPSHVLRLVLKQGVEFAAAGAAVGLLIALITARWIEPLLYKQSSRDPVVSIGVGLLMILVGLGASAMPAWRAIPADPNRALSRIEPLARSSALVADSRQLSADRGILTSPTEPEPGRDHARHFSKGCCKLVPDAGRVRQGARGIRPVYDAGIPAS